MSDTHTAALSRELGGKPLPDLGALEPGEIDALTRTLRGARRNQQQQLQRALEAALGHVPVLLRGAVRKILTL
ncbi:MAG TPA: hypothetical protein VFA75_18295 [Nevskia sp.]|nr:hypothetical protein [Nevskia sp.]